MPRSEPESLLPPASMPVLETSALPLLMRLEHPVWIFDLDRLRVLWGNQAALQVWQADSLEELCSRDMGSEMSQTMRLRLRQYQQDFCGYDARFIDLWTLYPHGTPHTLRVTHSGIRLPDGRIAMFCEGAEENQPTPETLRSAEAVLHTSMMISLYSEAGERIYSNPAARATTLPHSTELRDHFVHRHDFEQIMSDLQESGTAFLICQANTTGGPCWHRISARSCFDAVTGKRSWLFSEVDISDLKETEARVHHMALHDRLTGLPNRHFISEHFQHHLEQAGARNLEAAILFIDIDRFKTVNDSLGHAAGDDLLIEMSQRLQQIIRPHDLIARLGGDEFLVLATATDIRPVIGQLGERLLDAVTGTMELRGQVIQVTPSIGISLFPQDGQDIDSLMRHADLAMYAAKDAGRNRLSFFNHDMLSRVQSRLSLENELRRAVQAREFVLHYQPRHNMRSGDIIGVEALVRWQRPGHDELVMPGDFISLCEDIGLIIALSEQVITQAALQLKAWQDRGLGLQISVNLSPHQFDDPSLLPMMAKVIASSGCDPRGLELEITESVLLGNDENTLNTLHGLRELGCSLAMDDFGTGYSNLAYLPRVPLNCMKIDRSFIKQLPGTADLTHMIISLGHSLGLRVIAEGVEIESQRQWLEMQACEEFQGYLSSHPLPIEQFESLYATHLGGGGEALAASG